MAACLVSGNQHECPLLYELVDGFVKAVGRGVMKVLILDRGLWDGPAIGRLKTEPHMDTVIPLKTNMDAYQDVMGLTRLKDFHWERFLLPAATPPQQADRPKDPVIAQREGKRQRKLQARQALSHPQPLPPAQTLLGLVCGVSSGADCPVPLTAVINRQSNALGEVHAWVLTTTAPSWSAQQTRTTYKLRTAIEPEFESWQPPFEPNHLIRGPFDADTGGTKWCGAGRRGTARCAPTRCTTHPRKLPQSSSTAPSRITGQSALTGRPHGEGATTSITWLSSAMET